MGILGKNLVLAIAFICFLIGAFFGYALCSLTRPENLNKEKFSRAPGIHHYQESEPPTVPIWPEAKYRKIPI